MHSPTHLILWLFSTSYSINSYLQQSRFQIIVMARMLIDYKHSPRRCIRVSANEGSAAQKLIDLEEFHRKSFNVPNYCLVKELLNLTLIPDLKKIQAQLSASFHEVSLAKRVNSLYQRLRSIWRSATSLVIFKAFYSWLIGNFLISSVETTPISASISCSLFRFSRGQ